MPSFVPRLSFRFGPQLPAADADIPSFLAAANDHALFLDSSVLRRQIDDELWDELLRVPRRIFLIEKVLRELAAHFAAVPEHPLRKAIRARNPALVVHQEPASGSPGFNALLYYLNLLVTRRFVLQRAIDRYHREHGVEPEAEARRGIEAQIQRDFGERGLMLCKKPPSPLFTDEVLVYLAIRHAVRTGQPTMILTGDHDIEEQFLKAIELITIHYFAMLVAREYKRDPLSFHPRVVDVEDAEVGRLFEAATLLDLGSRRVQDFRPASIEFVPISCCLLGHYFSQLTYGAETAMSEVLDVKDRTGGRSTDLFGERDVHAYFVPEVPNIPGRHAALISRDVRETVSGSDIGLAKLDCLAAISTGLNMSTVTSAPSSRWVLTRRQRGTATKLK